MRRLGFGTWTLLAMGGAALACGDDAPGGGPVSPAASASSSAPPSASSAKPPAPPSSSSTSKPPAPPAPVLDASVPGTFFDRVRHLVEGKDARQKGVTPGALTARRAALVSGTVLDREGKPLANATVRVPHDGGWGTTTTLADGSWELVVQGGERVLVQIEKEGYLLNQRWASPRWNRYVVIEPVVLIPASAKTTAVSFGAAGWQTARGELSKDSSGTRTAMVLFPPGVTATATASGGAPMPLAKGTFRVTEYTVGDRGPQAMPGNLPPLSGYTYASEFTIDEAKGGAVAFDKPVIAYLDNFLAFPVGTTIPAGAYEADRGAWSAGESGKVVKVVADGANLGLDATGDGVADPSDPAEILELAKVAKVGDVFWRVPLRHFLPGT